MNRKLHPSKYLWCHSETRHAHLEKVSLLVLSRLLWSRLWIPSNVTFLLQESQLLPWQDESDRSADGLVRRRDVWETVAGASFISSSSSSHRRGEDRDQGKSTQPRQCQMWDQRASASSGNMRFLCYWFAINVLFLDSNYIILKKTDMESVFNLFQNCEENKTLVYVSISTLTAFFWGLFFFKYT